MAARNSTATVFGRSCFDTFPEPSCFFESSLSNITSPSFYFDFFTFTLPVFVEKVATTEVCFTSSSANDVLTSPAPQSTVAWRPHAAFAAVGQFD